MSDVNLLEYGNDSMRVFDSTGDLLQFGADNGYLFGVIVAFCIAMFLFLFVIIFFGKKFKNLIGSLFGGN